MDESGSFCIQVESAYLYDKRTLPPLKREQPSIPSNAISVHERRGIERNGKLAKMDVHLLSGIATAGINALIKVLFYLIQADRNNEYRQAKLLRLNEKQNAVHRIKNAPKMIQEPHYMDNRLTASPSVPSLVRIPSAKQEKVPSASRKAKELLSYKKRESHEIMAFIKHYNRTIGIK